MKKFLQNLRQRFFWYFLKEQMKKLPRRDTGEGLNLEKAKSVGILFDATNLEERKVVLNFVDKLKRERKKVRVLGFFNNKLKDNNFTFWHFNRNNIDWAMRPKNRSITEFIEEKFDLFINVNPEITMYAVYISALSQANFKVGPVTEHTYCYDLMIDAGGNTSVKDFIKEVQQVLEKTNV